MHHCSCRLVPLFPVCSWVLSHLHLLIFFLPKSLPQTKSNVPHPDLLNSWATLYSHCLGQKHVLNCFLQLKRDVRWIILPFSTWLNSAYNKTISKNVTTSQLCMCVCVVCRKEFAKELIIFPWSSSRIHNQDEDSVQIICEFHIGKSV